MSKISIFKFNTNNVNKEFIDNIIKEYLNTRGFSYNYDHNCYMNKILDEKAANKEMLIAAAKTAIVGTESVNAGSLASSNTIYCLSYYFTSDQLIITAYTYNKFSSIKSQIQPGFNTIYDATLYYNDINNNLFTNLNSNNVILVSSEKQKIKDGSGLKLFKKTLMILIPVIIIFTIIILIAYNSGKN